MPYGEISWLDLTVWEAAPVRDFYRHVVGFDVEELDMGGYSDYCMKNSEGTVVAGVCHARHGNADLPAVWIPYFTVKNLDASLTQVRERGGHMLGEIRSMGEQGRYAIVKDPAGAVAALFEKA